jgi:hypothetical protein
MFVSGYCIIAHKEAFIHIINGVGVAQLAEAKEESEYPEAFLLSRMPILTNVLEPCTIVNWSLFRMGYVSGARS